MGPQEIAARFLCLLMPEVFAEREKPEAPQVAPERSSRDRPHFKPRFDSPRGGRPHGRHQDSRNFSGGSIKPRPAHIKSGHESAPEAHPRAYGRPQFSGGGSGMVKRRPN
jgi:hypothetical protein